MDLSKLYSGIPDSWLRAALDFRSRHPRLETWIYWWLDRTIRGRDSVIQRGVGAGLKFNSGRAHVSFITGMHEPAVQCVFQSLLKPGWGFYDVGANVGFYSVIAARLLGPSGHIVSFEPVPENAQWIEHNAELNDFRQISIRREALGDCTGDFPFLTSEKPTWGKLASAGKPPADFCGQTMVRVERLDDLIKKERLPPPHFVKMDIEGAEAAALNGASETLSACRPILVIDLHGTNAEVAEILESHRYQSVVLGSTRSIVDSPWNACVLSAPRERADLTEAICRLANVS